MRKIHKDCDFVTNIFRTAFMKKCPFLWGFLRMDIAHCYEVPDEKEPDKQDSLVYQLRASEIKKSLDNVLNQQIENQQLSSKIIYEGK